MDIKKRKENEEKKRDDDCVLVRQPIIRNHLAAEAAGSMVER